MSTGLKNTFISQHNLSVHLGTCPIVSRAPENQKHKIFWLLSEPGGDFPFHRYRDEGHDMLARIVTGDESWVHHYQLETKRASMQRKHPASPDKKSLR
jgi:hypothetical protein